MSALGRLSERERGVLAAAAVVIAAILMVSRGWPALARWEAMQEASARTSLLKRSIAETAAAQAGVVRDTVIARVRLRDSLFALLVAAPTAQAAAAGLGATLERLAFAHDVRVMGLTMLADSAAAAGLARIGIRMSGESDVAGLMGLLFAVETRRTPLNVTYLNIAQPEPTSAENRVETLHFDVVIQTIARLAPSVLRSELRGE